MSSSMGKAPASQAEGTDYLLGDNFLLTSRFEVEHVALWQCQDTTCYTVTRYNVHYISTSNTQYPKVCAQTLRTFFLLSVEVA